VSRWTRGEATIERLLVAGELGTLSKEAQDAVASARLFIETAAKLLPELGFFAK
jgi:hypothetical protein